MVITSLPTRAPSILPTETPTTTIPTAQPSITGLIITVTTTKSVTDDVDTTYVDNLVDVVEDTYNVTDGSVSAEVSYTVSGELNLDLPDGVTTAEVEDAVIDSLSEALGIHPKDVTIDSIDLDTGVVTYTVSADTYKEVDDFQAALNDLAVSEIETSIQVSIPDAEVESNTVDDEVDVEIEFTIDASETDGSIGDANGEVDDNLQAQDSDLVVSPPQVDIVTSKPSMAPSTTTLIPTRSPSVTGIIVTISVSKSGESMNTAAVNNLTNDIAVEYGVDPADVDVDVSYSFTGSMTIDIPDDLTEEEAENLLEKSIADSLDLHEANVDVNVDMATGEVTYTITSSDLVVTESAQEVMQDENYVSQLNDDMNNNNSFSDLPVTVQTVAVNEDVVMDVTITVDATDAVVDVDEVTQQIIDQYEEEQYDADGELAVVTSAPTQQPQVVPTTSLPTAQPSMTGVIVEITATTTVTQSLSTDDLSQIEEAVKQQFNVSDDKIDVAGNYLTCVGY